MGPIYDLFGNLGFCMEQQFLPLKRAALTAHHQLYSLFDFSKDFDLQLAQPPSSLTPASSGWDVLVCTQPFEDFRTVGLSILTLVATEEKHQFVIHLVVSCHLEGLLNE